MGGVAVLLLFLGGACRQQDNSFERKVKQALAYQMREYPESTLKDVYKNFFQDRYGPGHLLSDTAAAGAYLRRELASYTEVTGPYFEPTGWEGNFYRVNLSVIKQQLVPYEDFFSAFVRSVQGITPVPVSEWKEQMVNDFERSVFPKHPVIERIKDTLYEGGALYAAMSGSGSSVFGLFEKPTHFKEQSLFSDCFLWEGQLS